jgi:hypothetical protein
MGRHVKGVRPQAIIAGLAVAYVASIALKFGGATVIWVAHESPAGLLWWALSLAIVALSTGAGGFAAARASGPNPLGAALAVGLLELLLVMSWFVFRPAGVVWAGWMTAVHLALIVPSALGGGYLARRAAA